MKIAGDRARVASAGDHTLEPGYRQAGCWHPQRSSVRWPDSLQYSLQYFPYGPPLGTVHWHAGWAHLLVSAMSASPLAPTLCPSARNHKRIPRPSAARESSSATGIDARSGLKRSIFMNASGVDAPIPAAPPAPDPSAP